MASIKEFVNKHYNNKNVLYLGDFNCDMNKTNSKIFPELKSITNKLNDVWVYQDEGTTENTYKNSMRYNIKELHKNYRYDAILYKCSDIKSESAELFGTEKIFEISVNKFKKIFNRKPIAVNKNGKVDWFLSDHFGLVANFVFV